MAAKKSVPEKDVVKKDSKDLFIVLEESYGDLDQVDEMDHTFSTLDEANVGLQEYCQDNNTEEGTEFFIAKIIRKVSIKPSRPILEDMEIEF